MQTAEDVVQKLIELTQKDQLLWREREGMGELQGYAVERDKVSFVLDFHGSDVRELLVDGTEIIHNEDSLRVLSEEVYRSAGRQKKREIATAQECATRQAIRALS
jgi:hypothetical protein